MNPHTLTGIEAQIYAAAWGAAFATCPDQPVSSNPHVPLSRASNAFRTGYAFGCAEEAVRRFREQAGKESPDG